MKQVIYSIKINGEVKYIGRSTVDRLDLRQKEHNRDFKKGKKKELYDYLHSINFKDEIVLEPIDIVKTKVEAKRKEIFYMILYVYFKEKKLYQRIPNIRDGGF